MSLVPIVPVFPSVTIVPVTEPVPMVRLLTSNVVGVALKVGGSDNNRK